MTSTIDKGKTLPEVLWDFADKYYALKEKYDELSAEREVPGTKTQVEALRAEIEDQRRKYHDLAMKSREEWEELEDTKVDLILLENKHAALRAKNEALVKQNTALRAERDDLKREVILYQSVASPDYFAVVRERDTARAERNKLQAEYDKLEDEIKMTAERRGLRDKLNSWSGYKMYKAQIEALRTKNR